MLTSLAGQLKAQIDNGPVSLMDTFEGVLHQITLLDRADAEGARLCAGVHWAEEREMSSRIFLCEECRRGAGGWFLAIRRSDGSLDTDVSSICESWVEFYSGLFMTDPLDLSARLPREARDTCEGPLSMKEVFKALEGMALEKSPGSDGLPAEFCRSFWHVLGADLVEFLNDSFSSGTLPSLLRGALISLIYKKGDHLKRKN